MKNFFMNNLRKFSIILFIVLVIAELFIFNYKAFLINPFNSSKYQKQTFKIQDAQMEGLSYYADTDLYYVSRNNPTITFYMDSPVKTMCFDVAKNEWDGNELLVNIAYATESYKNLRSSEKSFAIIDGLSNSKYVTCSYSGNVQTISLTIMAETGTYLHLKDFCINQKIPFKFSVTRFLILFLLSCFVYTFIKYPAFKESFNLHKRSHKYATAFTLVLFLLLTIFVYNMYVEDYDWFGNTEGNQLTQEVVDAFENGQVHLLAEVPEELLALENPYDWSERTDAGLSYKWDHLLFEGKYYSYYGIAPVLTLFLPYHMITGYYFPSSLACLLYTLIATLFVGLCFLSIVRNWFGNTPFKIVMLGTIITICSSCAIINVLATQFYEISQSSALCFLVIGFYFMLNSGIFMNKKIKLNYLFFSSLFISLAVLSRATSGLYAFAMVIWIVYGLFQYRAEKQNTKTATLKYIVISILPYVFFGILQMTYNYLRFKNPFDFGIEYSLTINDFTRTEMHLGLVMISIINFLFAVPIINTVFPFIHGNFDSLNVNGYYFVATKPTIGLLPSTLPVLSLFYAPKLRKHFNFKQKLRLFFIWFLPGIIFPITLIAITWESGYAMRYGADFSWQLCIAAFIVIFYVYNRLNNETIKKWLFRLLFVSTVWCIMCYISVVFTTSPANAISHSISGADTYYRIRNLIAFWN